MRHSNESVVNRLTHRMRTVIVLVTIVALAVAVPASAATTWRTHGSASSRGGTTFVSEAAVGATFRGADAIQLQFRSPDGTARKVKVWYFVICANGKTKGVDYETPATITTKEGGAWTSVTVFKIGTKAGECYAEGGGWYPNSSKQLDVRLRSSVP